MMAEGLAPVNKGSNNGQQRAKGRWQRLRWADNLPVLGITAGHGFEAALSTQPLLFVARALAR